MECEAVPGAVKIKLSHQKRQQDPFILKANISRIQEQLIELVRRKNMKVLYPGPNYPGAAERMHQHIFGSI